MELNTDLYNKSYQNFKNKNNNLDLEIQEKLASIYKSCKNRLDAFYMIEEPIIWQQMNEGYVNYYSLLDKTFFHPYNCKVKSQEIYMNMDYIGFMKGGVNLNHTVFHKKSDNIIKELFNRSINACEELNLEKLFKDLEEYLFNYSIYQMAHANIIIFTSAIKLEMYPKEPLLGFGHTFLKDLSEQHISNHQEYENTQIQLKMIKKSLGHGITPFDNFSAGINILYNALHSLQSIELTRERFLTILVNNHNDLSNEKITINLKHKRLTTSQIGFLFFLLREEHCKNYEKHEFREWFQKNFIIIKKDNQVLQITVGNAASDLLAQYKNLNDNSRKFELIRKVLNFPTS